MILTNLPKQTQLFRAHMPEWAGQPTSGAGAAKQGGRFNRKGVEALYLSLDAMTALHEYQQTAPFLSPCTLCFYTATLNNLVDLRQLYQGEPWDNLWHRWQEDWRNCLFEKHVEPPTWRMADMVLSKGFTGIVFPSMTHANGTNLVVYSDQIKGKNSIIVHDPDNKLPHNQDSWK